MFILFTIYKILSDHAPPLFFFFVMTVTCCSDKSLSFFFEEHLQLCTPSSVPLSF